MDACSMDLRKRVVAACDARDGTRAQIAGRFKVSVSWITKLLRRRRDTGSIAPRPHGGGQPPAYDDDAAERLRRAVAERPDATLGELAAAAGVACGSSATDRALRRLRITRKKSRSVPPNATAPTSGRAAPTGVAGPRRPTRAGTSSSTRPGRRRP
jgi:transposase